MMHRTHRPDSNRDEIVKALEEHGWTVKNTGMVGNGFPDLIALKLIDDYYLYEGKNGLTEFAVKKRKIWEKLFIEVKSPKGKYTADELKFEDELPGLRITLRSREDVERLG
jgi:hypothetical protein